MAYLSLGLHPFFILGITKALSATMKYASGGWQVKFALSCCKTLEVVIFHMQLYLLPRTILSPFLPLLLTAQSLAIMGICFDINFSFRVQVTLALPTWQSNHRSHPYCCEKMLSFFWLNNTCTVIARSISPTCSHLIPCFGISNASSISTQV